MTDLRVDGDCATEDSWIRCRLGTTDDRYRLHRRQLGRLWLPIPRWTQGLAACLGLAACPRRPTPRWNPISAGISGTFLYTDHSIPAFTEIPIKRWLLEKNRDDLARAVVYRLHGVSTPETKAEAEAKERLERGRTTTGLCLAETDPKN